MIFASNMRRFAASLATVSFLLVGGSAFAQEISEAHLKAARDAIAAIKATAPYDEVLPAAADALKQTLIERNPNLQELIIQTVDEKTLALASRRTDLEKEAAAVYARLFTEAELTAIAAFYSSETGQKLLQTGPTALVQISQAAEIWQRGVARDLQAEVVAVLEAAAKTAPQEAAPAEDAPAGDPPATDGEAAPEPAN